MSYSDPYSNIILNESNLYRHIEAELQTLGYSYQKPKELASAILKSSDYLIQKKGPSPWMQKDFCASYLAHFLPMNLIRIMKGFERLDGLDLTKNLKNRPLYDYGCGPFTLLIAYCLYFRSPPKSYKYYDSDPKAIELGQRLIQNLDFNSKLQGAGFNLDFLGPLTKINEASKDDLLCLSYSLNELKPIPKDFFDFQSLLIFEPSTPTHSRNLLEFRRSALENHDFFALAPCTHNKACPLFTHSKKDWCFDRAHFEICDFAQGLYKNLPFDQKQVTFSYLFLDKSFKSGKNETTDNKKTNLSRIVGDELKEKGKTRLMVCRGERREFLSILKKQKLDFKLHLKVQRGDLFDIPEDHETKGNEVRLSRLAPK